MTTPDIIGSIGVFILLLAYFLSISNKLEAESKPYLILNIIGAGLAGYSSYLINYYPFVVLEFIWVGVSFYALVKTKQNTTD
jgi:hypothetical protein